MWIRFNSIKIIIEFKMWWDDKIGYVRDIGFKDW
jgi:hypothetical protein